MPPHAGPDGDEPPAIVDRSDTGGAWSVAWPLAALAVIGALTLRACVTSVPSAPEAPRPAPTAPAGR